MTPSEHLEALRQQGIFVLFYTSVTEVADMLPDVSTEEITAALNKFYCNWQDHEDFYALVEMVREATTSEVT